MKRQSIFLLLLFFSVALFASEQYSLEALKGVMYKNNTELRAMDREIYSAELDVKNAKAAYYPSISLQAMGIYMANPPIESIIVSTDDILTASGISLPVGQTGGYVTLYDGMENTYYGASLSLTQPITTWGKIPLSVKAYKGALSLQNMRKSDRANALEAELTGRVYSLKYVDNICSLLTQAKELALELASIAQSSKEQGVLSAQELLEIKLQAQEIDVNLKEAELQRASLLQGIITLTGLNTLECKDIVFPSDDITGEALLSQGEAQLKSLATASSSLTLRMIGKLRSIHEIEEEILNRSIYGIPDVGLQLSLGYGGSRFPFAELGWQQKDDWSLNVAVVVKSDLFDGGRKLNEIKRSKSKEESDDINYESAVLQLESAVDSSYNSLSLSSSRVAYLELKAESLELRLEQTRVEVKYGQKGKSDELKDMLSVIENEIALAKERITLATAALTLDYLIGND